MTHQAAVAQPELLVLGAGPAGMAAAITAARLGLDVEVVEDSASPGGQVYRTSPPGLSAPPDQRDPDRSEGDRLRAELARSGARVRLSTRVWFAGPGFSVAGIGPEGPVSWTPRALLVAAGTTERMIPVPGSTLPGVVGLAAATILLKTHQALPGRRTLVAGAGPLLAAVAAGIVKGGGEVAAVVDLAGRGDWLKHLPQMTGRPDLLARGVAWLRLLRRAGVPILHGHTVTRILGDRSVEAVEVAPADAAGRARMGTAARRFPCDAVAIGHGLVPSTELTRLIGAAHDYQASAGGWVVRLDADQQTSVPGLFAAGDGTGITGAAAAVLEGELAALAAARHLGRLDEAAYRRAAAPVRARLDKAARFGRSMGRLMAMRDGLIDQITPDTIVCRCEDITRRQIDEAAAAGLRTLNQLKSAVRCGMGPCQGRMCGEAAAELLVRAGGTDRETVGQWTARAPVRPVQLDALVGTYSYDDIPRPPPAPA